MNFRIQKNCFLCILPHKISNFLNILSGKHLLKGTVCHVLQSRKTKYASKTLLEIYFIAFYDATGGITHLKSKKHVIYRFANRGHPVIYLYILTE